MAAAKPLVVFDLDGTLVDSRRDLADSANQLLAEYGAPPLATEAVVAMVGEGAKVLVERALTAGGIQAPVSPALERFLVIYERRLAIHTRLYPGVREGLDALAARAQLAVLTNKPTLHTSLLVDALAISDSFFEVIGFGDDFPRKPDPAALLHLVMSAGVTPSTTVMVGDSMVDVDTARRAGTRLVVALYGLGRFDQSADLPAGTVTVAQSEHLGQACLGLLDSL